MSGYLDAFSFRLGYCGLLDSFELWFFPFFFALLAGQWIGVLGSFVLLGFDRSFRWLQALLLLHIVDFLDLFAQHQVLGTSLYPLFGGFGWGFQNGRGFV